MSETFVDTMGGGGVKYVVTSFMDDNLPRFEVLDQFVIGDTATIGQHELANGLLRELGWSPCHLVIENLNGKICFFKMFFFSYAYDEHNFRHTLCKQIKYTE